MPSPSIASSSHIDLLSISDWIFATMTTDETCTLCIPLRVWCQMFGYFDIVTLMFFPPISPIWSFASFLLIIGVVHGSRHYVRPWMIVNFYFIGTAAFTMFMVKAASFQTDACRGNPKERRAQSEQIARKWVRTKKCQILYENWTHAWHLLGSHSNWIRWFSASFIQARRIWPSCQ